MEDNELVLVDISLWLCDLVGLFHIHLQQIQTYQDWVLEASGTFFVEVYLVLEDVLVEDDSNLQDQSQTNLHQNCCGGN